MVDGMYHPTVMRILTAMLFAAIATWGMYGFGGNTLVDLVAHAYGISFRSAAIGVSFLVGVFGSLTLYLWTRTSEHKNNEDHE